MHEYSHVVASAVTARDEALFDSTSQIASSQRSTPNTAASMIQATAPARADTRHVDHARLDGRHVDHARLHELASHLQRRRETRYERLVKPVLDRTVAAVLIVVLSPVLLTVALAVLLSMGRPIFFGQVRAGRFGGAFPMLKFRTMHPDRRSGAAYTYCGPERRVIHKSADDPRHTRLGRWMRKLSLDELPQLFNVLTGKMSLVGPRPEIFGMTADYAPWQHARHLVKPGVTGLWQTTERGKGLLLHECIDLDLRYIERLSPREDLRILLRTPVAIVRNRGVV